ncbi:hypothetical protein DERP_005134 [Dermatophagoides pteronyssinus]|uniref:Uncharacterized protein n=1 Tax=Dermatophagoides pteronyssinus TaxID=6956 RepID=A0ABQ8JTG5_DERPT|nr:hypothetical protein DERP_005134 [Dermatophagoides pteronyssinus]
MILKYIYENKTCLFIMILSNQLIDNHFINYFTILENKQKAETIFVRINTYHFPFEQMKMGNGEK